VIPSAVPGSPDVPTIPVSVWHGEFSFREPNTICLSNRGVESADIVHLEQGSRTRSDYVFPADSAIAITIDRAAQIIDSVFQLILPLFNPVSRRRYLFTAAPKLIDLATKLVSLLVDSL
jgi:hypothetical protein